MTPIPASGSDPEETLAWLLAHATKLQVEREYRFHPTRKWRFDFAFPAHRIAVEVEGGSWVAGRHTRGSSFEADLDKYNSATVMGWWVLRVTPRMVEAGEAMQLIEAAVEARDAGTQRLGQIASELIWPG